MKGLLFLTFIILILLFCAPVFFNVSTAAYFASDTVYLYEYGERIHDSAAIFPEYGYGRCEDGVCDIGQQFYPVTIHRVKDEGVMTWVEFHRIWTQDRLPSLTREKLKLLSEEYLKYLEENSLYSISFDPGPAPGGEPAPPGNFHGGRIGDYRAFVLDFFSGEYMLLQISPDRITVEPTERFDDNVPYRERENFWIIYLSLTILVVLVLVIYFFKRFKKSKQK